MTEEEVIKRLKDAKSTIQPFRYVDEAIDYVIELLEQKPSQPKAGHWIDDEFGSKCSCCGIHTHLDKFDRPMKFRYCSMCGAKMEVNK